MGFEAAPKRLIIPQYIFWLAWLLVTVASLWVKPNPLGHGTHLQLGLTPCPSVVWFHRPCPACGLTTSFAHTVRGQFAQAVESNPFGPVLYAFFTITAWLMLFGALTRRKFYNRAKWFNYAYGGFLTAFLAFGFYRFATTKYAPFDEVTALVPKTASR